MARLVSLFLCLVGCSSSGLYGGCDDGSECESPADGCYRVLLTRSDGSEGDGSLCTRGCASDADCPDGVCLALVGDASSRFLCYPPCEEASDCPAGLLCTPVTGADGAVCLP